MVYLSKWTIISALSQFNHKDYANNRVSEMEVGLRRWKERETFCGRLRHTHFSTIVSFNYWDVSKRTSANLLMSFLYLRYTYLLQSQHRPSHLNAIAVLVLFYGLAQRNLHYIYAMSSQRSSPSILHLQMS